MAVSTGSLEVPFTESRAVGRGYIWGGRSRVFVLFLTFIYFIWLYRVLVGACRLLSSYSTWAELRGGTWNLSHPTRDRTCVPCFGRHILNHWISREVPRSRVLSWGVLGLRCLGEVQGRMLSSGSLSRSGAQQESGLE